MYSHTASARKEKRRHRKHRKTPSWTTFGGKHNHKEEHFDHNAEEDDDSLVDRANSSITTRTTPINYDDANITRRKISFGRCDIRTYDQIIGDHPCCMEGCPITLDWRYKEEPSIPIDEYESIKETLYNATNSIEEYSEDDDEDEDEDDDDGVLLPAANVLSSSSTIEKANDSDEGDDILEEKDKSLLSNSRPSIRDMNNHSLRLSPEERKAILINQMRRKMAMQHQLQSKSDPNISVTTEATYNKRLEREFYHECRRLNRYKGRNSWCVSSSSTSVSSH